MTVLHSGTTPKYSENWEQVFGKGRKRAKPAKKKTAAKKKASPKKKTSTGKKAKKKSSKR